MLLVFFLAWIVFNGRVTWEIAWIGAAVSLLMYLFMCKFLDYSPGREKKFYRMIPFLCRYIAVLVKEIVLANIGVCRILMNRRLRVEPVLVRVKTNLHTQTARVLLANSITLTPGTITVSVRENELLVHCLDVSLSEGMEDSVFVKMLENMEKEAQ